MKDFMKSFRVHFFLRQAGVLEYCLIRIQKFSVRPESDDELRYGIDDCSKFSFGFGYFVEGPRQPRFVALAVVNVGQQHVPAGDTAFRVSCGESTSLEPAVHAVGAPLAKLENIRQPGFDRTPQRIDHARKVIGMDGIARGPIL